MSLINQMLRDLESRRKATERQLPTGEMPAVTAGQNPSRRLLALLGGGLLLIAVVWGGLEYASQQLQVPTATVKQVAPASLQPVVPVAEQSRGDQTATVVQALSSAGVDKKTQSEPPITKPPVDEMTPAGRAAQPQAATEKKPQPSVADPPPPQRTDVFKPQPLPVVAGKLLSVGALEAASTVRLMFEFEQLPSYQWQFVGGDEQKVGLRLETTTPQAALQIPRYKGPVLTGLQLQEDGGDLVLLMTASHKLNVEIMELPEDAFHGERLMVELGVKQPKAVPKMRAPVATSGALKVDPRPARETESQGNRVTKKVPQLSLQQQVAVAMKNADEQLRSNQLLAAETSLAHALTLKPELLDARLKLVELLEQSARQQELEKQLLLGLQYHPSNSDLRKKYARQLMATGHLAAALNLLLSDQQPAFAEDLEYFALLAALQQESGQHGAAAGTYRQLLSYRPQEALWWFGLAISYDQAGAGRDAKEAYRQAIALPGLRADLLEYAAGRLQTL
jgi:Flp pilus assembly protein TadD